ncbi:NADP-dependent isocitrate dehydrogenase [Urbifossiella limnaea]|uniref:isocitrate dehydrogenase (NADP(+)) n=1 Tax=Urbifossiella limnaea TaxID=2528023 RepID=A0A517XLL4_9BACT|nr:NADP-dependent isocitrate dehydrogenase [Urbifossiella limnaea]QDU18389.1 Isocitrate dehydrogenase [NADP] 1 [Urbifossiella limnaea]
MTAPTYDKLTAPTSGTRVTYDGGKWTIPNDPIVVLLKGDGIGADVGNVPGITTAAVKVLDAAVKKAYGGTKKVVWFEAEAGDEARKRYCPDLTDDALKALPEDGQRAAYLPDDTLKAFDYYKVGLKGPLTTPIGGGFRSINVYLRFKFDLYGCVRPVRYYQGVDAPNRNANKVDMCIFRENTEDVYCGIEFKSGTDKQKKLVAFLREMGYGPDVLLDSAGIGIKPISPERTRRLVRMAIQYAVDKKLPSVTLCHKGNIMKFTEGAFKDWGYELAKAEFRDHIVTEDEVYKDHGGKAPAGKIVVKDRIADSMFQQIQLRPDEYSVIATPNLNGDYLSDAVAALTGGIGLAAGANIGDGAAMFEATHGTAPKYTGKNRANPGAVLLSGALLLEFLQWFEAANLVNKAVEATFAEADATAKAGPGGKLYVTYDIARQFPGYGEGAGASSTEFADRIIHHIGKM